MRPDIWETVKAIFEEISDYTPEDRRRILEGLELETRREVERLLASYDASTQTQSSPARSLAEGRLIAQLLKEQYTFDVGQLLLNRFEIRRLLGTGGMGEVYEAYDRILGEVAIKTLRLELVTSRQTLAGFRREVTRGRRVAHPNVCRIYDLFETEESAGGSVPFFTMELLSGETLQNAIVSQGPFPEERARTVALALCAGLQAAHDSGIIHGDFKCGNVILAAASSGEPQVKITDFGLARVAPWIESTESTATGSLLGTKQYLSRELLAGAPPSVASDLFALGVVLFHLRTGRYPFDSDADWDLTRRQRDTPPTFEELATAMEPRWARVVSLCLSADATMRPSGASAVSELLSGPPSDSPWLSRRNIVWFGITAGAALVTGEELWRRNPNVAPGLPAGPLRTLIEEFTTVGGPPAIGRAARNLLRILLAAPRIELVKPGEVRAAMEATGLGGQSLRRPVSLQVASRTHTKVLVGGSVAVEGDRYKITCQAFDPSANRELMKPQSASVAFADLPAGVAKLARLLRERLGAGSNLAQFGAVPLEEADTNQGAALESFTLGLSYYQNGEPQAALENLREATRLDPDFAVAYLYEAVVLCAFRKEDQALAPSQKAYDLRLKLNSHHRLYVEYYFFLLLGDYESAHRQLRNLVELFPDDANLNRQLASSYALIERPEMCLEWARRSAELDPGSPLNQNVFISALAEVGRTAEADSALRSSLKRFPNAPPLLYCAAYLHLLNFEIDPAIAILQDLIRRSPSAVLSQAQLAKAFMLGGRWKEARAELETRIPVLELDQEWTTRDVYRYWLGQSASVLGDRATVARQAVLLSEKDPLPSSLPALRAGAELAWLAGDANALDVIVSKLRKAQQAHRSTRAQAFQLFAEAARASLRGDSAAACDFARQACGFWPDLTANWLAGELLLAKGAPSDAVLQFDRVIAARTSAIRYDSVNVWVRSLASAAACLEALGRHAQAASYWSQFKRLWGNPSQYVFAPRLSAAAMLHKPTF